MNYSIHRQQEAALSKIMAALVTGVSTFLNIFSQSSRSLGRDFQQIRNYVGCRMRRDAKRRKLAGEYAEERLRLVAMKRNDILPIEIRDLVEKEIQERIPRQTALRELSFRCVLTSRPRGIVYRWRLSRIMFRDLADYNKLAGIQRAMW
ncbi:28S ribosomal protein S14, mitochondrial-like [Vespa mandarinia]|uniref:28S ribosomal protein S14, mitochondrial-like n=1 Tax=Vespa mandarinia TaxID=7446 RepID=UPI00161329EC|nr:28S ribosomal protein S14, mitochondrial-like [Vespa mandarinia]